MPDFRSLVSFGPGAGRKLKRLALAAARIAVGVVFVAAGAAKLGDPASFADSIASFRLLPGVLVSALALGLPPFEILSGLLLAIGWRRSAAALSVLIATGLFAAALVSALARGLIIDCGCFGSGAPSAGRMWLDLLRDLALFAITAAVYADSLPRHRRATEPQASSPAATRRSPKI